MAFRIVKFNHKIFLEEDTMKKFAKIAAVALVVVLSLAILVACAPNSDPEKAKASLEKNGYTVVKVPSVTHAGGLQNTVTGTKTEKDKDGNTTVQHVSIFYYDTADNAKAAYETLKSDSEKEKGDNTDWTFAQSGKIVYFGTKAAINAAR